MLVLWTIALLTLMTLSYHRAVRAEIRNTTRTVGAAQTRAIATAGIWVGVRELLDRAARARPAATPLDTSFADAEVRLRFQDQEGLIDLNAAGADLIEAAAIAARIEPGAAHKLAAAIVAYRTPATSGNATEPVPLGTIEELRDVPGVTADLYVALKPFVTVHSGRYGIDPQVAPPALARAASVSQQIQTSRRLYAIVSEARTRTATQRIAAIVRLGGPPSQPVAVYAWQEDPEIEEP